MKRTVVVFISVLLASTLTGIIFVDTTGGNFLPAPIPPGIHIASDGSVNGTNKIQCAGDVYTFTGDVNNTIVVLRSDIVIDGAGYALTGNGATDGVCLRGVNNVSINNLRINNFSCGIVVTFKDLPQGSGCHNISNNTLTGNTYGIFLGMATGGTIVNNNSIINGVYGISISYSGGNILKNNRINGNQYNLCFFNELLINDIDSTNTVNGKPVYYWVNQNNRKVPADAGFVGLVNCANIIVQDLTLTQNEPGLLLVSTSNSIIKGNNISNNNCGIMLSAACHNRIEENEISSNTENGIYALNAVGNKIIKNVIINNTASGLTLYNFKDVNIIGNNITSNAGVGIILQGYQTSGNNIVSDNFVAKNALGIQLATEVGGYKITGNTLMENNGFGLVLNGWQANNEIYLNNFLHNNIVVGFQVSQSGRYTLEGWLPANPNEWDNGTHGNYWSDYKTRYPMAKEINNTGIGNTTYYINENNIDHFPLMAVFDNIAPYVLVFNPENKIYAASNIELNFAVNELFSKVAYSLDGNDTVTVAGNTTLSGLTNGSHNVTVYAWDKAGNVGASETVHFSVAESFPNAAVIAASGASATVVGAALLVYFRKSKR